MAERKTIRQRHPLIARTPGTEEDGSEPVSPKTSRTFYLHTATIEALDAWAREEWERAGKRPSASEFVDRAILQALKHDSVQP